MGDDHIELVCRKRRFAGSGHFLGRFHFGTLERAREGRQCGLLHPRCQQYLHTRQLQSNWTARTSRDYRLLRIGFGLPKGSCGSGGNSVPGVQRIYALDVLIAADSGWHRVTLLSHGDVCHQGNGGVPLCGIDDLRLHGALRVARYRGHQPANTRLSLILSPPRVRNHALVTVAMGVS